MAGEAIALKQFQPSDFLTQLLGGNKQTTTTTGSANIAPSTQVFNQSGPMSPAEMDALIESISTTAAQKIPELTQALANAAGTRTTKNSPLALALQQNQLAARNQALTSIGEQNIQRSQVQAKAAGDIAAATRGTREERQSGADPIQQLLLGFGLNKLDKKGWLDWAKNAPTAPAAVSAAWEAVPTWNEPTNFQLPADMPDPTGGIDTVDFGATAADYSGGLEAGAGFDFGATFDTGAVGEMSDVFPSESSIPYEDIPYEDIPVSDISFEDFGWSDYADGGSANMADRRRLAHIEMQNDPALTMEAALSRIIADELGQVPATSPTAASSSVDPTTGIDFFGGGRKGATPAPTPLETPPKTRAGAALMQKFMQFLQEQIIPNPAAAMEGAGYSTAPPTQFADGGMQRPSYGRSMVRSYADGGAVNTGRSENIRLNQPAYAYNPPNRAPSVRAPLPGDRGYLGFAPTRGDSYGFGQGYADGGRTGRSGGAFGTTSPSFADSLSRVITPYADGGAITRNKNYMGGRPQASMTSAMPNADMISSDEVRTRSTAAARIEEQAIKAEERAGKIRARNAARAAAEGKGITEAAINAVANYFSFPGATSLDKQLTGATPGSNIVKWLSGPVSAVGAPIYEGAGRLFGGIQSQAMHEGTILSDTVNQVGTGVEGVLMDIGSGVAGVADTARNIDPLGETVGKQVTQDLDIATGIIGNVGSGVASFVGNPLGSLGFADGKRTTKGHKWDKERPGELLADGGIPQGGFIRGPGTGTSDSIRGRSTVPGTPDVALSTDEYIIPADVVSVVGPAFFDKLLAAYHTPVRR